MNAEQHSAMWSDRIQDAVDASTVEHDLQAHLDGCEECRREFAKLSAIHQKLAGELANTPLLGENFSARVFARIDEREHARAAAKLVAEREFRRRTEALRVDWRDLWQRHFGSVVAAATVIGVLIAGLGSTWSVMKERVVTLFATLPFASSMFAAPMAVAFIATGLAMWWVRAKTN